MVDFAWELPTRGDSRHVGAAPRHRGGWGPGPSSAVATDIRPGRFGPFDALDQIIAAVEITGYDGLIAPYDPGGEESWIVAGNALRHTRHTRVGVEFHPGFGTPVYATKLSATLQRLSGDRLDWHLIVDTTDADDRSRGDGLSTPDKYRRADEFLAVAKGVWTGAGTRGGGSAGGEFNHAGRFYDVIDGGLDEAVDGHRFPTVYISGASEAALDLSGRHGDVHLFELPPDASPPPVTELSERAHAFGRVVRAGLRLPVIARVNAGEAWARLRRQWGEAFPDHAERDLESGRIDDLTFTGFQHLGHRASVGLVGSYEAVAQRISELSDSGVEVFVLSGVPHLEELHRNAEHLLYRADRNSRVLA
ncbi:LLM class flavin-dependent oxidoreductase [Mycobacterium sp. pUA109]|uniref:LLM class flavin-dependent oxidoreductase n=1 Tax=Mycobacterium sp. pUA109 TaxID=3238982 RepID=UPI00351B3ECC